jgi:hypothetical protein
MRPTDSEDLTVAPAKPNGAPAAVPANGRTRKRGTARRAPEAAVAPQKLADFAAMETPAMDAAMWPVHAMAWLQPDLAAEAPQSSGLRVERRHRVPVPDFVRLAAPAASRPHLPERECEPLPPRMLQGIPRCDLAPLGWDPRTACATAAKETLP